MIRFVVRRLILAAVLTLFASSAALLLARLAPGDLTAQLGPLATPDEIAATRARFALDRGPLVQWAEWVGRAARFDLGESFLYSRPVAPLVGRAALNTAMLALAALVVATLAGIGLGLVTGSRGGVIAGFIRVAALVALSLPPLLTTLVLLAMAARTRWLPVGGMISAASSDASWRLWWIDVARHLILPTVALALPFAAILERLQAASLQQHMRDPHVTAAAARGVDGGRLVLTHVWRISLRPICAVYGIVVGALLSGSFIVEYVTAWPGLGRLTYEALRARDVYLVCGCVAAGALLLSVGTLTGDLLLAAADPRVRETMAE